MLSKKNAVQTAKSKMAVRGPKMANAVWKGVGGDRGGKEKKIVREIVAPTLFPVD